MSRFGKKLLYPFETIFLLAFLFLFVSAAQTQIPTLAPNQPIEKTIKLKEKHTYTLNLEPKVKQAASLFHPSFFTYHFSPIIFHPLFFIHH